MNQTNEQKRLRREAIYHYAILGAGAIGAALAGWYLPVDLWIY